LEYSADGQLLAVVNRGELQIFDAQNYRELDRLACGFCFLQFDRDGSLLTAISTGLARWPLSLVADPEIEISASRSTAHISLGPPVYLSSIAAAARFDISRDGKSIAIPTGNQIQIQPPAPFEPSRTIGPHHDIRRVSISPDGSRVVTGGWGGGKACVWDIATGQCLHTFEEPDCCLVQFSPNGKWLVTNSNKVTLWNAQTWEHIADMPVDGMSVNGVQVCFSPDSRVLAVSDSTARINLFDPVSGRKTAILTDPNGDHVSQMVYNPNGNQLAVMAGNRGGVVHVWDLAAIRDELKQRNLDRSTDDYGPVTLDINAEKKVASAMPNFKISDLKFIPDQLFVENEAVQQDRLLRQSVENFDIMSARSAIKNIIKLQPQRALTCNNLAWTLAVGPQPLRDTKLAVEFARRAIADESLSEANRALYTNTLGVALYRNDRLEEATRILEQSLAIQPAESQPFDLYFLSMCSSRSGNESQARDYFDRAESLVKQFEAMMPVDRRTELVSFSEEAKQLLACRE
jgi:WD40 repeat protein